MCGFAGFVTTKNHNNVDIIKHMLAKIHHRGPNDDGFFLDENNRLVLGHKRLSIQDLSPLGHQPMLSNDGRYIIVFNGEIYNFKTLKTQLNYDFKGSSDTEVFLAMIVLWGLERALKESVGMFAFALWDKHEKILTLARDRMGEKPLYYGIQNGDLLFASELSALKQHPSFENKIDKNALASFMRYSYVPTPYSIYQNIKKLAAGHYYQYKEGQEKLVQYWSVQQSYNNADVISDEKIAKEKLSFLLNQSVAQQMISDVPTGAFLSGGVDSSLISALMQQQSNTAIDTFTIGFENKNFNEATYAKAVAKHLKTNHHELILTAKSCLDIVPNLATIYSEPFADSSQIPTFLVSQMAKENVTVALSGDGADELFCGYNRYFQTEKVWQIIKFLPKKLIQKILNLPTVAQWNLLSSVLGQKNLGDKIYKLATMLEVNSLDNLYYNLTSQWQQPNNIVKGADEYVLQTQIKSVSEMMLVDQQHYLMDDILTKVDRAGMAVSLETRMPLLDYRLVEFSHQIPLNLHRKDNQSKYLLRQMLYDFVPKALIDRPKMGFGVPIEHWLRDELKDWAESLLQREKLEQYFHSKPILEKWQEHLSKKRNWQYQLWNVLMFMSWLENQSG
jgi:asparagine synthase (glutamine-hydrolysing)